jgi:hypothetical protein
MRRSRDRSAKSLGRFIRQSLKYHSIALKPAFVRTGASSRISTSPMMVSIRRSCGLTGDQFNRLLLISVTRQRVYSSDRRKEAGDELDEPLPAEACRLAAPLVRCEPEPLHLVEEPPQARAPPAPVLPILMTPFARLSFVEQVQRNVGLRYQALDLITLLRTMISSRTCSCCFHSSSSLENPRAVGQARRNFGEQCRKPRHRARVRLASGGMGGRTPCRSPIGGEAPRPDNAVFSDGGPTA